MLCFLTTPDGSGLSPDAAVHATLDAALDAAGPDGRVFVRETSDPHGPALNIDAAGRYWPPAPVEAAGGYVVRDGPAGRELLLIFRRGAWDLPKGKLDPGETLEEAAHREVCEEVGIPPEALRVTGPLGTTVHGYPWPRRGVYAVKTTHWFAMETTAERFAPEAAEGIEAAVWVPWDEAGRRLGFESLRAHHAGVGKGGLGFGV